MMKTLLAFVFMIACFVAGFFIYTADIGGESIPYYEASDKLLLTQSEWEEFKQAVAEDSEADLSYIDVINHGETILVEYSFNVESESFPFGKVEEQFHYQKSMVMLFASFALPLVGIAAFAFLSNH